jgi:hypothetical protein
MKEFNIPGTVVIAHDIHAKSEEGLKAALAFLGKDYDVKDCNTDEHHPSDSYFAKLKDSVLQHWCKCDYCHGYSTWQASKCHGYRCDKCGKVLWEEYTPGSRIKFTFVNDSNRYLTLKVHSYDEEGKRFLCYTEPPAPNPGYEFFCVKPENYPSVLERHKDDYEQVEVGGEKLIALYYPAARREADYESKKIKILPQ